MELQRITKHTKPADRAEKWHVIDAEGERLGRLATKVAGLLQGKHRPDYSRHQLNDDFVIVVNASKIGASGNKMTQKVYYRHSGYLGSLRTRTLEEMLGRFPERVIELAVKGMLPRNRLGRRMLRRLKVYAGATHPHEAQVRMGMGKHRDAAVVTARPAASPEAPVEEPAAEPQPIVEETAATGAAATEATVDEPAIEEAAPEETTAETVEEETVAEEATVDEPAAEEPAEEAAAEAATDEPAAEAPVEEAAAEAEAATDELAAEAPVEEAADSEESESVEKPEREGESN